MYITSIIIMDKSKVENRNGIFSNLRAYALENLRAYACLVNVLGAEAKLKEDMIVELRGIERRRKTMHNYKRNLYLSFGLELRTCSGKPHNKRTEMKPPAFSSSETYSASAATPPAARIQQ